MLRLVLVVVADRGDEDDALALRQRDRERRSWVRRHVAADALDNVLAELPSDARDYWEVPRLDGTSDILRLRQS